MPDPQDLADLELLTKAAHEAGEIATRYWRRDPEVWHKPLEAGPVSEADLEIDRWLYRTLTRARPDYGWLSEETEDNPNHRDDHSIFVIDPIDGTRAFIDGAKTWAHSLAVVRGTKVTTAVVFLPIHQRLFIATKGGGAQLNGSPISASQRTEISGATMLANKWTLGPDFWPGGTPLVDRQFRSSLAYRLSLVGQGRFDAMVTFRNSWEWDIAAGSLIASEAGATVSDRHGKRLSFNNTRPYVEGVIAAPAPLHENLLARTQLPIA
ncbi:inositol monophosphatase family protein [Qingshengfaniella alkalisoli]|uniref:3'(2'),5'-bisphosphate nucleotidase CysQ n=1 Tax=Qingshengfaniella alkalisoli TaxID=2599296 RepID=A0A5B8I551_9RHOB|nr:3'(2'),5'-bisphosphate nucleotidase CysQ [Qingshengfaniella alkalisoli]QDY68379.1 3'(2'),5'-bisphosphate nucleotidase CysQ [Qingshengfaniella alkalisoli]